MQIVCLPKFVFLKDMLSIMFHLQILTLINLAVLYDAGSFLRIVYKYDVKKNNWLYLNSCIHVSLTEEEIPVDLSKVVGPTIDDFDYLHIFE